MPRKEYPARRRVFHIERHARRTGSGRLLRSRAVREVRMIEGQP